MSSDIDFTELAGEYLKASMEIAAERYPDDPLGVDKAMCDLIVYSSLTNVVEQCGNDLNALRQFQTGVASLASRLLAEYGVPKIEEAA